MIANIAKKACYLLFFTLLSLLGEAQLKADFNSDIASGCSPVVVNFTDNSLGNPTSWKWDLGNGTTSFLQNPSVTYFDPGTYEVKLVITKNGNADSVIKTSYITVYGNPSVEIGTNKTAGCYPLPIIYMDSSNPVSGSSVKWEWDFGDGYNSDVQNPIHTYENAGNFNVTLRVTNSFGCATTISKTSLIKITDGVKVNFSNNTPRTCMAPASFDFQNLSTGSGELGYKWDFGDGNFSIEENPRHTYTQAGSYSVKLIGINENGCSDTIIKTNLVTIGSVKAAFTNANSACVGTLVSFTNQSNPTPSSVTWYFGDGTTSTESNPKKTYTVPGTYDIKLIANFGACLDSAFRKITIQPKPVVDFTVDATTACKAPLSVNFTNFSTGATTFKWYFGDGDSSLSTNPNHVYTKAGTYTVSLVAVNNNSCTETLVKSQLIKVLKPYVSLSSLPDSGCVPFTKSLSFNSNLSGSLTNFQWSFGDGITSNDPNPTHTYNDTGRFTVTLTVSNEDGCEASTTAIEAVIVTEKPKSAFSATPRIACAEEIVTFTDESTGNITNWFWDFGDGTTSTDQNPTHMYSDTGYFDVQLVVWSSGCPDTLLIEDYMYIKPPIAKFKSELSCTDPFNKVFIDNSIGADSWSWDFGDGTTSSLQNPKHTYTALGYYEVKLTVFNASTGCSYMASSEVPVVVSKANFYATDTIICKNTKVTFNVPEANQAFVTKYAWDFGDGNTRIGSGPSINHVYVKSGTYDVTLIITNSVGCSDTLVKTKYILVEGPTTKFEAGTLGTCLQTTVSFTDQSVSDGVNAIEKWVWSYGDGKTDTLSNSPFEHFYSKAGLYTVTLKTIDSKGCSNSYTLPNQLTISQPKAEFKVVDTLTCPGKQIKFTTQSSGNSLTSLWSFGDGITSTTASPTHGYINDGKYTIKLTVTDKYGCTDSITKPEYVRIASPKANFLLSDSVSTCPPLMVYFTDKSENAVSKKWDFGDNTFSTIDNPSHFYTYPGTYIVKQIITGPGGCVDVKEKSIVIRGPRGTFEYDPLSGCKPIKINFKATTQDRISFIWDFSDGNILKTKDSVVTHIYDHFGEYVPKMILVDASGCNVAIPGKDTIRVSGADAKFSFTNKLYCDSATVAFTDTSKSYDKIIKYNWNFGDGNISTDQNATHTYTKPGSYITSLSVTTQNGCSDKIVAKNPIIVIGSPKVTMTKTFNGCIPLDATFKGIVVEKDTSALFWNWDLGNGNSSVLQNPEVQTYSQVGIHNINLTVTNSSGCFATLKNNIEVYPLPIVSAGVDTMICKGSDISLTVTGATKYIWKADPTLSCITCETNLAKPTLPTRYFVTGTSAFGCVDTASVFVDIKNPFKMKVNKGDTLCAGESLQLLATGAHQYNWSPSLGLNNSTIGNPIASPDSTVQYRVVGVDDKNCFTDTGYVRVKVYPIPTVDAGEDKTINVGQSISLTPKISKDITVATWTPSIGIANRTGIANVTIKPKETTEYSIEVKNPGGCSAQDKVTVFVVCNGGNIFMPNTFSPNSDGINDVFYPRGTGIYSIKSLRIFNRWGELIFDRQNFKSNDAAVGWNGMHKGSKLTPDVYVYTMEVLCENNSVLTTKGNIALIN